MADLYEVESTRMPIDSFKILLGYDVDLVFNGRVLGKPSPELPSADGFADQLNGHPTVSERLLLGNVFGNRTSTDLGDHSEEFMIPKRDLHEATDLPNSVAVPIDKH